MCLNNQYSFSFGCKSISIFFYRLQSHLTLQTEHQRWIGIVRVSFRDRVNHDHYLNLAPTLIITTVELTVRQKVA